VDVRGKLQFPMSILCYRARPCVDDARRHAAVVLGMRLWSSPAVGHVMRVMMRRLPLSRTRRIVQKAPLGVFENDRYKVMHNPF
jgi:hypothetical protein